MIFINNIYILLKNINNAIKKFVLIYLLVKKDIQKATQDIFLTMYNSDIEITKKETY